MLQIHKIDAYSIMFMFIT